VYCGQTDGRVKIKLGVEVGLGPGHIVKPPNYWPVSVVACNGYRWIKMPLAREADLGTGDTVLDGDPAPQRGTARFAGGVGFAP